MKNVLKSRIVKIAVLVISAFMLRFYFAQFLGNEEGANWLKLIDIALILIVGAFFILKEIAQIIEETTEVLSERTKIASGLLQSLGTAFPDMILGIMAAIMSLRLVKEDYGLAINFAIIAAATTFGSNIYNIAHALWCVYRQNMADKKGSPVAMLPYVKSMGQVIPMERHQTKPSFAEMENSIEILNILTILTAVVAIAMVIFGKVEVVPANIKGDLYQLIRPVGLVILALSIFTMYYFRKTKRKHILVEEVVKEEGYYHAKPTWAILSFLLLSGIAIVFAAEGMVMAVEEFCAVTGLPFVIAGVIAGAIGCMGEMIVVHNFTVNPKGRIGDALVGVSMDNIVTIMGASIVAVMGGIFLGGSSLILIFVIILTFNTMLIWQISKMKNYFLKHE